MKQRMSRDHKARKNFKWEQICKKTDPKLKLEIEGDKKFMTLTFLGYYDKTRK